MNRVLLNFTLSLLIGAILPKNPILFALIFSILFIAGIIHFCVAKRLVALTIILGIASGAISSLCTKTAEKSALYPALDSTISCTVNVDSVPVKTDKYTKFTASLPEYENEKMIIYMYDAPDIKVNQELYLENLSVRLPGTKMNFGSFDYRKYLTGRNIYFQGSANGKDILQTNDLPLNLFRLAVHTNYILCKKIDTAFSPECASVLKGVLLGDKSDLSDETEKNFRNSGLSHVLAVSGLHLTMITMLLGMLLRKAPRIIKIPILALVVIGFAFVTGLPASVVRAATMLLILYIGDLIYAEADGLTSLSAAALLLFAFNPNCIYDTGFVLSFSASLGIILLYNSLKSLFPESVPDYFKDCISVSLSAQIGTLPFLVLSFGQLTTMSVISNLLVGLLMPIIYVLCTLSLLISSTTILILSKFILNVFIKWAEICANIPGQVIHIPINVFVIIGLFIFSGTALLNSLFKDKKIPVAIMFVTAVCVIISSLTELIPPKNTTLTFLNVGQADCTLVETPDGNKFLVDCATDTMADSEIVDYLNRNAIFSLDGVFISHFNDDHSGGLIKVLEDVKTNVVYIPDTKDIGQWQYDLIEYAKSNDITLIYLSEGDTVSFTDLKISVLNPPSNTFADGDNNSSAVLKVENKDVSLLLPGDIEEDASIRNCDTDILKVSHHGSKNGTTQEFLKNNTPEIAVISLGFNNMYGFPKQETIDKIENYTDKIYRTDLNGTVKITCNNRVYTVDTLWRNDKWKN
ncbi:MAG: DNA internalization-related competence protein ComEC/Rec2 [Clostridia bacterium]|nr:DNA internalization-related competence protein ComEC/Rec2 [Clostridia bacterium]